jgi:hypothetical protein
VAAATKVSIVTVSNLWRIDFSMEGCSLAQIRAAAHCTRHDNCVCTGADAARKPRRCDERFTVKRYFKIPFPHIFGAI